MKPEVYGFIPKEFLVDLNFSCKVVIDPPISYFNTLQTERLFYEKMVLIQCEPKAVNNVTKQIIDNHRYFDKIYCYDEDVLSVCDNSELFHFGSCWALSDKVGEWITQESQFVEKKLDKKFKVSFIKSNKNFLEGHILRNSIPSLLKNKEFEGLFLQNIPIKFPLFEDSMFHITIENVKEKNYFTEKIVDCFMTRTIPIYWGCPNIGDVFEKKGIITFETVNELELILNNLGEQDYINRLNYIEKNYLISKKYAFIFERVNNLLLNIN